MKKLSLVLVFLIVLESLCLLGVPAFAADVTLQGNGTSDSPYLISTAEELSAFVSLVNKAFGSLVYEKNMTNAEPVVSSNSVSRPKVTIITVFIKYNT